MKPFQGSAGRLVVLGMLTALVSGCASMFAPASDRITINSVPEGAKVYLGANLLGTTPLTYEFKRSMQERKTLSIRKDGYKTQELLLGTVLEPAAFWNFGFITTTFGATSWGIDAMNGNMVKYSPDSYLVDLEKAGGVESPKDRVDRGRLRFVAANWGRIRSDIAWGGGEYLTAYFELRSPVSFPAQYRDFLVTVSHAAPALLLLNDPVVLYRSLEVL